MEFTFTILSEFLFTLRSNGLELTGQREIIVEFNGPELRPAAEDFLRIIADYVETSGRRIESGETMNFGYWLTKFLKVNDGELETWEYNPDATAFVQGGSLALRYWKDQHAMCVRCDAAFEPPRPDRLTAIDPGVFRGLPVQGVRYPSPEHMSGWWITTDAYDGNIANLKTEHTYHVTAARPDLAKYLALPPGFCFDTSRKDDAWFDEQVANERDDDDDPGSSLASERV